MILHNSKENESSSSNNKYYENSHSVKRDTFNWFVHYILLYKQMRPFKEVESTTNGERFLN